MSRPDYARPSGSIHWQEYLNREHAARDKYLTDVASAHREYLTGPWPDRGAYEVMERQAWMTYYAAGRDAWKFYRAALETPPPPPAMPAAPYLSRDAGGEVWPADPPYAIQPTFNPITGGDQ